MGYYATEPAFSRGVGNGKRAVRFFRAVHRRKSPSRPAKARAKQGFSAVVSRTSAPGVPLYGYRYYSPELGRWVNRDPIEELVEPEELSDPLLWMFLAGEAESTEIHLYLFVKNSPVQSTDMLGLYTCTHEEKYKKCQCPSGSKKGKKQKDNKETNGCSYPSWLPQPPGGVDNPSGIPGCSFKSACDAHDCCYGSCGAWKIGCDDAFKAAMIAICNSCASTKEEKKKCKKWRKKYYNGVNFFGYEGGYADNQVKHCEDCCCP